MTALDCSFGGGWDEVSWSIPLPFVTCQNANGAKVLSLLDVWKRLPVSCMGISVSC